MILLIHMVVGAPSAPPKSIIFPMSISKTLIFKAFIKSVCLILDTFVREVMKGCKERNGGSNELRQKPATISDWCVCVLIQAINKVNDHVHQSSSSKHDQPPQMVTSPNPVNWASWTPRAFGTPLGKVKAMGSCKKISVESRENSGHKFHQLEKNVISAHLFSSLPPHQTPLLKDLHSILEPWLFDEAHGGWSNLCIFPVEYCSTMDSYPHRISIRIHNS